MSEKNSNKLSLIIAIIAIILILGGIYLLNKSFSAPTKSSANTSVTKTPVKSSQTATVNQTPPATVNNTKSADTNTSVTSTTPTPSTTAPNSSNLVSDANNKGVGETPQNPATKPAETTPKSTATAANNPSQAPVATPLEKNEISATYLGLNASGQARFEITECGNKSSIHCLSPNKFSINNTGKVALSEGKNYRLVADYSEDASYMIFRSVSSITEVK